MSVLAKSASRHYSISDAWLDDKTNDKNAYIDLKEIQDGTSQYVTDQGLNATQEAQKACFFVNGLHVEHDGHVIAMMADETAKDDWKFNGVLTYPEQVKRIYARGTVARGLKCVGIGQTYGNF